MLYLLLINNKIKYNIMNVLIKDVIMYMALYFELNEIISFALTNKKHYNILSDNIFWMNKVLCDYGKFGHIPKILNKKFKFNINIDWKSYYKILHYIGDPAVNNNKAIRDASYYGHVDIVRLLLNDQRTDPLAGDNCAIEWAILNDHIDIVRLLLNDQRVDPSANNNYVIYVSSKNGHSEIVRLLLNDNRTDPSANDNEAIICASENGHSEVVRLLLNDKRIDPSANNNEAIRCAHLNGHTEVVKLLFRDHRTKGLILNKIV